MGFDPEADEDRDIIDAEAEHVMNRFGNDESIMSDGRELIQLMMRGRPLAR